MTKKGSTTKKLTLTFVILAAVSIAISMYHLSTTSKSSMEAVPAYMEHMFNLWAMKYEKTYATPEERMYRLGVFQQNVKTIEEDKLKYSYDMGLTQFSDLTTEEAVSKYTGLTLSDDEIRVLEAQSKSGPNPKQIDWRQLGRVNPVRYQNTCGACWAFSAVAAIESLYAEKYGNLMAFSEQQLLDCTRNMGNDGCAGGWMHNAFKYLKNNKLTDRDSYPYENQDGTCRPNQIGDGTFSIKDYVAVTPHDGQALEDASAKHGVISVAVQATTFFSYRGGILDRSDCGHTINHGVSMVGYGTENGKDYWIVRNQWGSGWGEGGYIRIAKTNAKGGPGMCGILVKSHYPVA